MASAKKDEQTPNTAPEQGAATKLAALAAYHQKIQWISDYLALALERLARAPHGSEEWARWSERLDAAYGHFTKHTASVHGRWIVLEAVELAAWYSGLSPEQKRAFLQLAPELVQQMSREQYAAYLSEGAHDYQRSAGLCPWERPTEFATFEIERREPSLALAIRAEDAQRHLADCLATWNRRPGRPRSEGARERRLGKWDHAQLLLLALGLGDDATPATLEREWPNQKKTRGFGPGGWVPKNPGEVPPWLFGALPKNICCMNSSTRVAPLSDSERAAIMREVRRQGEASAARALGVPRQTIARALARLPMRAGTILLVRTGLSALTRPNATQAAG